MSITPRFFVVFLMVVLLSSVNGSLNVNVDVEDPEIYQGQSQTFIISSNEGGIGILLVVQPAEGTPWMDLLADHPTLSGLWTTLSNRTKAEITEKLGQKIVSFAILEMDDDEECLTRTFPEDFAGINGEPGTEIPGDYHALLVFLSHQRSGGNDECCCFLEVDFDCVSWPVIPEFSSGLLILGLCTAIALAALNTRRRLKLS
jgi:hypothetical protein